MRCTLRISAVVLILFILGGATVFLGCDRRPVDTPSGVSPPTAPPVGVGQTISGQIVEDSRRVENPLHGVDPVHGRNRSVLLVDDSRDTVFPRDSEHDAFWRTLFAGYGMDEDQVDVFSAFGENDGETLIPTAPTLEELNRYRSVVWYTNGAGYNGQTALLEVAARHPILADYIKMGGKLWLSGRLSVAATILAEGGRFGDFIYPKTLAPDMFAWDCLRLKSDLIDNDKGRTAANTLSRVAPVAGKSQIYPEMNLDKNKLHPAQALWGGVTHVDAVFGPINMDPGRRVKFDFVYEYGAIGPLEQGRDSAFHETITGIRWSYAGRGPIHGRVQWFGFPFYYFDDDEAQETFNRTMDWLLERPGRPGP